MHRKGRSVLLRPCHELGTFLALRRNVLISGHVRMIKAVGDCHRAQTDLAL